MNEIRVLCKGDIIMNKYIGYDDHKGLPIYENSVIGLRLKNSTKYMDEVRPVWNEERNIYEFYSIYRVGTFYNVGEPLRYLCIGDLYGWGSTFEVIYNRCE